MKTQSQLATALNQIELPDPRGVKNPNPIYEPILQQLGVTAKKEVILLRDLAIDKSDKISQQVLSQNYQDLMAGKIKRPEDMPLYREETGTGVRLHNIPDELMRWYAFIAWLNGQAA